MSAHSLHGYFLSRGDPLVPIDYRIESLRHGRSFATRQITALQHGQAIFRLSTSFQVAEEGLEYQQMMPDVPLPEELPELAFAAPEHQRQRSSDQMRVDIRPAPVDATGSFGKCWWLKVIDLLPDEPHLHRCALAYLSDFGLIGTAREAHGISFRQPGTLVASLDHSLWFHRPPDCSHWLLHVMDCPSTSGGRGFARGRIYNRGGLLLASCAQEGVLRVTDSAQDG